MTEDAALLHRYANAGDDAAFAELVRRHIDVIYASAVRVCQGNSAMAQDVTQRAFTELAQRARQLRQHPALLGWLHTTARFTAMKMLRDDIRRHRREQESAALPAGLDPVVDWDRVQPLLDDAFGHLKERERAALLLRFFEGRSFKDVGAHLALSETAARSCVDRALDRLRRQLSNRGINSTAAALGVTLAAHAAPAAPVGLSAAVTSAALAATATAGAAGATLGGLMAITKLQLGLVSAIALAGATVLLHEHRVGDALRRQIAATPSDEARAAMLRTDNQQIEKSAAALDRLRKEEVQLAPLRERVSDLRRRLEARDSARAVAAQRVAVQKQKAAARAQAAVERAISEGVADLPPRVTATTRPEYPPDMAAAGIPGEVVVSFIVGADGAVHNATAVKSTRPEFEAAAEEAILGWSFEPGVKARHPVNTHLEQSIQFSLPTATMPAGDLKPVDRSGGVWLQ